MKSAAEIEPIAVAIIASRRFPLLERRIRHRWRRDTKQRILSYVTARKQPRDAAKALIAAPAATRNAIGG
jgi:hypothetical protein